MRNVYHSLMPIINCEKKKNFDKNENNLKVFEEFFALRPKNESSRCDINYDVTEKDIKTKGIEKPWNLYESIESKNANEKENNTQQLIFELKKLFRNKHRQNLRLKKTKEFTIIKSEINSTKVYTEKNTDYSSYFKKLKNDYYNRKLWENLKPNSNFKKTGLTNKNDSFFRDNLAREYNHEFKIVEMRNWPQTEFAACNYYILI
jgi:hypothetical protein